MNFNKLKNTEWISVAKGAGIAAAGAALAYLSQWTTGQDFGVLGPVIAAVLSVAVNAVRKYSEAPATE